MNTRRYALKTVAGTALAFVSGALWGQDKLAVGVLMLHGKNSGGSRDPNFGFLKPIFEKEGWQVAVPDMPWSRNRYLEGNWDQAMLEIGNHVSSLKAAGAQRIVLVGHSMGVPAALSHAARGGQADALVLLAPGHIPRGYYQYRPLKAVRESIDEARKLLAEGRGDETHRFTDINQGREQPVITTPRNFLSYFDPESDADMGVTAPRVPPDIPVLTVIGESDSFFRNVRSYLVDRLPVNPKTQFLEVSGGHRDTPQVAKDEVVAFVKRALSV